MEELDNRWILVDSESLCPEGNSAPATLGLTNMAGMCLLFFKIIFDRFFLCQLDDYDCSFLY